MKFLYKQAMNAVLSGEQRYTPQSDAQIRALTVHNPSGSTVQLAIKVGEQTYINKAVADGQTEVISQLFNQQIAKNEPLTLTGDGLCVLMTVVELVG